jgi:hypothetical protein
VLFRGCGPVSWLTLPAYLLGTIALAALAVRQALAALNWHGRM